MFRNDFYFRTIRRYVAYFGTCFNDIDLKTYDPTTGELVKIIRVPLTYMPKDKMMARLLTDPNIDKQSALELPMMSFEMGSPYYDGDRKLLSTNKFVVKDPDNPNKMKQQFMPVPYDIPFTLHIYVKLNEDATKIVEQILPFFKPDWTATVFLIDEMDNYKQDIPIVLNGITKQESYQGSYKDRQVITWDIDFVMKAYLFGPVKDKPIIKFVDTNLKSPGPGVSLEEAAAANTPSIMSITVQPGLDANGHPTSNIAHSVNTSIIMVDSDFGFCTIIEDITEN